VCFVTDCKIVVVTDNSVELWEWESGVQLCSIIDTHVVREQSLPDLTQNNNKAVENSLVMRDIKGKVFEPSTCARYTCATLSQDCQYVIVGASDISIRVWDVEEGKLLKKIQNQNG
jgi:WD40 repeat protein